eukprot:scaffold34398_cov51-Attheya_sp.AAC.1
MVPLPLLACFVVPLLACFVVPFMVPFPIGVDPRLSVCSRLFQQMTADARPTESVYNSTASTVVRLWTKLQ